MNVYVHRKGERKNKVSILVLMDLAYELRQDVDLKLNY